MDVMSSTTSSVHVDLYHVPEASLPRSPAPSGTGTHTTYLPWSNEKLETFDYRNGKHHGRYVRYHPAFGRMHIECHFVDGVLDGKFCAWDYATEQQLLVEGDCKDGVFVGSLRTWKASPASSTKSAPPLVMTETLPDDKEPGIVRRVSYDVKGAKTSEEIFRNGRPDGVWRRWASHVKQSEEFINEYEYKEGVLVGVTQRKRYPQPGFVYEIISIVNPTGDIISDRDHYYDDGKMLVVIEVEATSKYGRSPVRVVTLRDPLGRDCLLPEGDVEVWKAGRAVVPISKAEKVVKEETPVSMTQVLGALTVITTTTITTIKTVGPRVWIRFTVPANSRRVALGYRDHFRSRVEFARVEQIVGADGTEYKEATAQYRDNQGPLITFQVGQNATPNNGYDPQMDSERGLYVQRFRDQCDRWHKE